MKKQFITEVQQRMLPYLNNEQLRHLQEALEYCLHDVEITADDQPPRQDHTDAVCCFYCSKAHRRMFRKDAYLLPQNELLR